MSYEYLRELSKKFETALMVDQRLGGNWFKKKTRSKKSRDTVPLSIHGPSWLHFEPLMLRNFDFDADPDPAFHSTVDPDPNPAILLKIQFFVEMVGA